MTEALHILDRFTIHFFSAYGLVSGIWFLLNWLRKKPQCRAWLPHGFLPLFLLSALVVCIAAFIREPYDIHSGQWWGKSYFDYASWILGSGTAVWGQYRFRWVIYQWTD
jgi:hypothetical protein